MKLDNRKFIFTRKSVKNVLKSEKEGVLNFQNLYSVYLFNHEPSFREEVVSPGNFVFPDGKILSLFLRIPQVRGPTFARNFLEKRLDKDQRHFFIGPSEESLKILMNKFPKLKNAESFDPPFIKGTVVFPDSEIKKMVSLLKKFKPHYIWVCIGNPKQEILANQLYREYKAFYFNIGAGMDFILGKKKEAPSIFRNLGLEWFYRLITDFKYSKKKVWRSFLALRYIRRSLKVIG